jgi:hypothetical protein
MNTPTAARRVFQVLIEITPSQRNFVSAIWILRIGLVAFPSQRD